MAMMHDRKQNTGGAGSALAEVIRQGRDYGAGLVRRSGDVRLPIGPTLGSLADVLSGPLGTFALKDLRKRPKQDRSVDSVGRILSAAAALTFDRADVDGISIERIAARAAVTPQAAYRYFKDVDELIRTGLRCVAVREHERVVDILSGLRLSTEGELASAVVGAVLEARDSFDSCSPHLHDELLGEYRRVGDDASTRMSQLICEGVDRSDVRHSLDGIKLSVALTATFAIATSTSSKKVSPLRGSTAQDMLTDLFVGVLRSDGRSFDAFREMDPEDQAVWDGGGA